MNLESPSGADIGVAELDWPKTSHREYRDQQEQRLFNLVESSKTGLIVDCALVKAGNSEIINLLMRVYHRAKQENKYLVLFHVPDTLGHIIGLCKLETILLSAEDALQAEAMIRDIAGGDDA